MFSNILSMNNKKNTKVSAPLTEELLKKIEKDSEAAVHELWKTPNKINEKALTDIMKRGAEEFKEKTGRNMTYSELRAAFG
jgi:predicted transcriptional regulator